MDQVPNYGDVRTLAFCAFCCGPTGTRDHCPSRVFLDAPLPENLPVVPACAACNSGFSSDEEYLACLVACVVVGTTDPEAVEREKIRRILNEKPALRASIEQSKTVVDGQVIFMPDTARARKVLVKLAQGHALYELHESCARDPDYFRMLPLTLMGRAERERFEIPEVSSSWPEVGSRAMQRLVVGGDCSPTGWIVVQEGRYRYNASLGEGMEVRLVIGEYLACHACWD